MRPSSAAGDNGLAYVRMLDAILRAAPSLDEKGKRYAIYELVSYKAGYTAELSRAIGQEQLCPKSINKLYIKRCYRRTDKAGYRVHATEKLHICGS